MKSNTLNNPAFKIAAEANGGVLPGCIAVFFHNRDNISEQFISRHDGSKSTPKTFQFSELFVRMILQRISQQTFSLDDLLRFPNHVNNISILVNNESAPDPIPA